MLEDGATCSEILAVYGPTRSGKSHYVRRLLHALHERSKEGKGIIWRTISVNANNLGSVRTVLEKIFIEAWKALVDLDDSIAEEERPNWQSFRNDLEQVRALILGEVAETSRELQHGNTVSGEGGAELRAPIASVRLGGKVETRQQESEKQVRRSPTDREVTGYIRDALEALRQFDPTRHTLLFVDDLDLLDRRGRPGTEVSAQLVDQLKSIADCRKCLVMVTIRDLYFNGREKDFNGFVSLGFLGVNELRSIYQQHVGVFNDGRPVFTPEVLELLVQGADGRVGIFLRSCRELWRYHIDASEPIGRVGLAEFLQAQLRRFKDDSVQHLIPEVERVLAGRAIQVEIEEDLQDTPLLYSVLLPVPGQPKRYTVNPLWLDVLGKADGG